MGASPCTSNSSSVPPKKTVMPLFTTGERVGESGWNTINFIYCVANVLHPQNVISSTRVSFVLHPSIGFHLKFCSHSLWSVVPESFNFFVLHSFILSGGGSPSWFVSLSFIFFVKIIILSVSSVCVVVIVIEGSVILGSLKEGGCE